MFLLSLKKAKSILLALIFCFIANIFSSYSGSAAVLPYMPGPGTMIALSEKADLPLPVGIEFHNNNPFDFNFVLSRTGNNDTAFLRAQAETITKYFFAALTMPAEDLWVNLSPYEKDRITTEEVAQTELGKDLLGEDYVLKQLASSLTYPESDTGKKYWDAVNGSGTSTRVRSLSVRSTMSSPTASNALARSSFTKVWIVPGEMLIEESSGKARVAKAELKVMCEEDYLAMQKNNDRVGARHASPAITGGAGPSPTANSVNAFKQHILPSIEQEVNQGKRFAHLRQIYYAVMLAGWFKRKLHDTVLSQTFFDKNKIQGANADDPAIREKIYNEYVKAFQIGAYNYVKNERVGANDYSPVRRIIKRAYFSGGAEIGAAADAPIVSVPDAAASGSRAHVKATSSGTLGIDLTKYATPETLADGIEAWIKEVLGKNGRIVEEITLLRSDLLFEIGRFYYEYEIDGAAEISDFLVGFVGGDTEKYSLEFETSPIKGSSSRHVFLYRKEGRSKVSQPGCARIPDQLGADKPAPELTSATSKPESILSDAEAAELSVRVVDWIKAVWETEGRGERNTILYSLSDMDARTHKVNILNAAVDLTKETPDYHGEPIYYRCTARNLTVTLTTQKYGMFYHDFPLPGTRAGQLIPSVPAPAAAPVALSARRADVFTDRYSFASDTFKRLSAMVRERFPDRGLGGATIWVNQQRQLEKDNLEIFFVGNDSVLPLEVRLQVKSNKKNRSNLQLSLDRNTGEVAVVDTKNRERLLEWKIALRPRGPLPPYLSRMPQDSHEVVPTADLNDLTHHSTVKSLAKAIETWFEAVLKRDGRRIAAISSTAGWEAVIERFYAGEGKIATSTPYFEVQFIGGGAEAYSLRFIGHGVYRHESPMRVFLYKRGGVVELGSLYDASIPEKLGAGKPVPIEKALGQGDRVRAVHDQDLLTPKEGHVLAPKADTGTNSMGIEAAQVLVDRGGVDMLWLKKGGSSEGFSRDSLRANDDDLSRIISRSSLAGPDDNSPGGYEAGTCTIEWYEGRLTIELKPKPGSARKPAPTPAAASSPFPAVAQLSAQLGQSVSPDLLRAAEDADRRFGDELQSFRDLFDLTAARSQALFAPPAQSTPAVPRPLRPGIEVLRGYNPPAAASRRGSEPEERSAGALKWMKRGGRHVPEPSAASTAPKVPEFTPPEIMQSVRTGLQNLFTRSGKGIVPHDWSRSLEERVTQALLQDNKATPLPPAGKLNLEITRHGDELELFFYSVDEENAFRATFDIPPSDLKRWPVPAKVQLIKKEALDLYNKVFGWLRKIEASLDNDTQKEILFTLRGLFTIRETAELIPQAAQNGTSAYIKKDHSLRYEITPQKALKVTLRILDHQWTGTLTLNAQPAEPVLQLIGPDNQPAPISPPATTSAPTTSAPVAPAGDIDKKALADAFAKNAESFGVAITADEAKPLVEAVDILRNRIGKEGFHSSNHVLVAVPRHGHFYLETNAQSVEEFNAVTLWREYMFAPSFKIDLPRVQSGPAAVKSAPTAAPASTTVSAPAAVSVPEKVTQALQPVPEVIAITAPTKVSLSKQQEQLARAIFFRLLHEVRMKQGWADRQKFGLKVVKGQELAEVIRQQALTPSANWKSRDLVVECTSREEGVTRLACVVQISSTKEGMNYKIDGLRGRVEGRFSYADISPAPRRASYGNVDIKYDEKIDVKLKYFFQKAREILGIKEERDLSENETDQAVVMLLAGEGIKLTIRDLQRWRTIAKSKGLKGQKVIFALPYGEDEAGRSQRLWDVAGDQNEELHAAAHWSKQNNSVYISPRALLTAESSRIYPDNELACLRVIRIARYESENFKVPAGNQHYMYSDKIFIALAHMADLRDKGVPDILSEDQIFYGLGPMCRQSALELSQKITGRNDLKFSARGKALFSGIVNGCYASHSWNRFPITGIFLDEPNDNLPELRYLVSVSRKLDGSVTFSINVSTGQGVQIKNEHKSFYFTVEQITAAAEQERLRRREAAGAGQNLAAQTADGGVKFEQAANGENIQVQSNGSAFTIDAGWSRPDIKGVRFRIVEIIP